jgi:hypothetical protein
VALGLVVVAPRPRRLAARAGVSIWGLALVGSGARALIGRRPAAECALLPVVLATMHLGHGVGTLEGVVRYGVPTAALARAAGLRAPSHPVSHAVPAYAPSLTGEE